MIQLIEGMDISSYFFCDFAKGSILGDFDEYFVSGPLWLGWGGMRFILWL